jgi:hypothetical protein
MKLVIRTLFFHILCIILFTILYIRTNDHFYNIFAEKQNDKVIKHISIIDFILFATTIQAGVGITQIYPITNMSKILVTIQQLVMLFTNVFALYIFTL